MIIQFANNAASTLATEINSSDTTILLVPGTGALFPVLGANEYFVGTISDLTNSIREIIWVTARSFDTLTVTRAQEGTTALTWPEGSLFQNLVTAGTLSTFLQDNEQLLVALGATAGPAGTVLMSNGPNVPPTWEYQPMPVLNGIELAVNVSNIGNNVLLAGVTGKRIAVFKAVLTLGATTTLAFKSLVGSTNTDLSGPMLVNNLLLDTDVNYWYVTPVGGSLIAALGDAVILGGTIYYLLID